MSASLADLKPVYLIYGSEELLLTTAVARLRERFTAAGGADFDIDQFDAESSTGDAIVAACNQLPFATDRRLVVVRNVERFNKDGLDALAAYADDPSPFAVLVLVTPKLAKNTRLFKSVSKAGGAHEYKAPAKRDYPAWVVSAFAERGRRVTLDAGELLVRAVGYDLRRLSAEIDKVVAFLGDRTDVTRADIEQVASVTASVSVFEFLDALGDRDCGRALRLETRLVADGESVYGLHAMAVRRIRDLIAADSLAQRGQGGASALSRELGRPDWQVKQLPRQAARFRSGELVDVLRRAAATEAEMKTSRDARLAFERWIISVCGG